MRVAWPVAPLRTVLFAVLFAALTAGLLGSAAHAAASAAPDAAPTAPPVPHAIEPHLPITAQKNPCLVCHDRPELVGHPKGTIATPMPASHYFRGGDGKLAVARVAYVCTTCHAAAGNAARGPGAPAVAAAAP
jgi:nitrate reductase cytochrome c-type subunit